MVDRTQEDINQDSRIAALEQSARVLRDKQDAVLKLLGSHTTLVTKHENDLQILNPLKVLVEHVEAIKDFITNIRSIRR